MFVSLEKSIKVHRKMFCYNTMRPLEMNISLVSVCECFSQKCGRPAVILLVMPDGFGLKVRDEIQADYQLQV